MRIPVVFACLLGFALTLPTVANISIKDRTLNEPLVLDQNEDYLLHKVYVSGVTDMAALTLTGRINSVTLTHCSFRNVWSGVNGKAVAAESQGAIVGSFSATDTAFEDAQEQLVCLREGDFGTVTFQRCKFRTSDSFLKKIYAADPWRTSPPTTEFANIDRLELLDNEYSNTILVVHPSVKLVVFRGDVSNVRLKSPKTQVIRLEKGQDAGTIHGDGRAVAAVMPGEMLVLVAEVETSLDDDSVFVEGDVVDADVIAEREVGAEKVAGGAPERGQSEGESAGSVVPSP